MAAFCRMLSLPLQFKHFTGNSIALKRSVRNFNTNTKLCSAYDPDGKTVVNVLNSEEGAPLMINAYSWLGFRLNNGIFCVGPIAIFPQSVLRWNIENDLDVTERSLSLFLHISPKLDVLVIGLSDHKDHKLLKDTRQRIHMFTRNLGRKINVEVLPTEKAVTTFNFLNSERRFVAAALIPPTSYSPTLDDEYQVSYLTKKREEFDFLIEK